MAAIRNIAYSGWRIDIQHSIDGWLPGGERVHATVPPVSRVGPSLPIRGPSLPIRKFQKSTFDLAKLVEGGKMSAAAAEFLPIDFDFCNQRSYAVRRYCNAMKIRIRKLPS